MIISNIFSYHCNGYFGCLQFKSINDTLIEINNYGWCQCVAYYSYDVLYSANLFNGNGNNSYFPGCQGTSNTFKFGCNACKYS